MEYTTSCGNDLLVNTGCMHNHTHVKDYQGFKSDTITTFVDQKSGTIIADLNNAEQYATVDYVAAIASSKISCITNDLSDKINKLNCRINCVDKESKKADEEIYTVIEKVGTDLEGQIKAAKQCVMEHSDHIDRKLCEMIEHNKFKSIEGDQKIIAAMETADKALDGRIQVLEEKAPVWDAKQDKLIPSESISIDEDNNIYGNYEAGFGVKLEGVEFSADTDVMATKEFVAKAIDDIEIVKFVSKLPEEGDPSFIYSVKKHGELLPGENTREEYVWHHDEWEKLGNGNDRLFKEFDMHRHNNDKHVTPEEKKMWTGHVDNKEVHVTTAEKEKWTAKQDALTVPQIHAINSGIDAYKVKTYDEYEEKKQDKLIAGPGISIAGSVISTTAHENFDKLEREVHLEFDKVYREMRNSDEDLEDRIDKCDTEIEKVNHLIASDVQSKIDNNKLAIEALNASKQNKLVAGSNVKISENVISVELPSIDFRPLRDKDEELSDRIQDIEKIIEVGKPVWDAKQDKLIAGKNIHIESTGVIDAVLPTKVSAFDNDAHYLTQHQDLSDYAKKSDIPVFEEGNRISLAHNVVSVIDSDLVTKDEMDAAIAKAKEAFQLFDFVAGLPEKGEANKIYLVAAGPDYPNKYEEYVWHEGWELIGQLQLDIDLAPYALKEDVEALEAECKASRYTAGDTIKIVENKINWALADKIYADKNKDNEATIKVEDNITVRSGCSVEVDKIIFRTQSGKRYAYFMNDEGVFTSIEIV